MTNPEDVLPEGWRGAKLGDIADVRLGKMLSAKTREPGLNQLPYLRNENVRWGHVDVSDVKTMGFKDEELGRYSVAPGDLLVCEGGEPGRAAIYTGPPQQFMYQKALHRVRLQPDAASAKYVQYFFQHYATRLKTSQTTIAHFPLERMKELVIPLAPRDQQERIVAEIEKQFTRLDAGVEALKRLQAHLRRYRAAVLRVAFPSPSAEGDPLPAGWLRKPLGEAVEILDRLRVPVNAEERTSRVGSVPYYGATGQVGFIDEHIFDEELVLLGEDGAPFLDPFKPKAYLIRGKSWVNNHAHVLRGRDLSNPFLMHHLNALDFHGFVTGTTRLKLPQAPMKKLSLLIPPREEQDRVVNEVDEKLSLVDSVQRVVAANLLRAARLRCAILRRAFEGSLPGDSQHTTAHGGE